MIATLRAFPVVDSACRGVVAISMEPGTRSVAVGEPYHSSSLRRKLFP
jgi:hypothetical protein